MCASYVCKSPLQLVNSTNECFNMPVVKSALHPRFPIKVLNLRNFCTFFNQSRNLYEEPILEWTDIYILSLCIVFRRIRNISKSGTYLLRFYVRTPAWNNSAPTVLSLMKYDIRAFFVKLSREIFSLKSVKNNVYLHDDLWNLWYLVRFFIEGEIFQTNVVDKIATHFIFSNLFLNIVSFMRYVGSMV